MQVIVRRAAGVADSGDLLAGAHPVPRPSPAATSCGSRWSRAGTARPSLVTVVSWRMVTVSAPASALPAYTTVPGPARQHRRAVGIVELDALMLLEVPAHGRAVAVGLVDQRGCRGARWAGQPGRERFARRSMRRRGACRGDTGACPRGAQPAGTAAVVAPANDSPSRRRKRRLHWPAPTAQPAPVWIRRWLPRSVETIQPRRSAARLRTYSLASSASAVSAGPLRRRTDRSRRSRSSARRRRW